MMEAILKRRDARKIPGLVVEQNRPLCDGTPRREKGFRGFLNVRADNTQPTKIYLSPLFEKRSDLLDWAEHKVSEVA